MRTLLQFLGLAAKVNPDAKTCQLASAGEYQCTKALARMRSPEMARDCSDVTYEIRADNLGGESFDTDAVKAYKRDYPQKAELLARFLYGVHVHTAHLTWGANHGDNGVIWEIGDRDSNTKVAREICRLLKERVYRDRDVPWGPV